MFVIGRLIFIVTYFFRWLEHIRCAIALEAYPDRTSVSSVSSLPTPPSTPG